MSYQKRADQPQFATLEERIKKAYWRDTWKTQIFGQDEILEEEEDILTMIDISPQIPINLEGVYKYVVGSKITR